MYNCRRMLTFQIQKVPAPVKTTKVQPKESAPAENGKEPVATEPVAVAGEEKTEETAVKKRATRSSKE